MVLGVQKTKETLENLAELAVDAAVLVKGGITFGSLGKVLEVLGNLKALVESAPQALPELMELDPAEAGEVATAAYVAVKKVVAAVTA